MRKVLLIIILLVHVFDIIGQQYPKSIVLGKLIRVTPKLSSVRQSLGVPKPEKSRQINGNDKANKRVRFAIQNANAKSLDKSIQTSQTLINIQPKSLIRSFDGCTAADNRTLYGSTFAPPDPNLCVGPNHIVQMVNSAHKVFDKSGNLLSGPLKFSSIASTSNDDGDPIVLYDQLADRWLLLQFNLPSGNESIIFCISQTSDPTGAYYVYEFPTVGVFPDYPHVGIWNNSYVVTTHEFNLAGTAYLGQGFYAVDRAKMVNGEPTATLIRFQESNEGGYLPVSMEGFKTPEIDSPPMFVSFNADEFGGTDELWIRSMNIDFVNPSISTLSNRSNLPVGAFDGRSPSSRSAVEQLNSADGLDAIADRMMSRAIYRRFDSYESMVMTHAVNVSGQNPTSSDTYQAAMRWYELVRTSPTNPWQVNQNSTYSPGTISGTSGENRWMGSVDLDQKGNIALAYSKSSSSSFPSINYAERKKSDPLNVLSAEQVFVNGGGSQTGTSNRWGDYTSLAIDPSDEETLWYTNEYYDNTSSFNWKTKIGAFKITDAPTAPTIRFKVGGTIVRQVESTTPNTNNGFAYKDYTIQLVVDQAPSQPITLELTNIGTAIEGIDYDLTIPSPLTLDANNLSKNVTLRVYDNALGEGMEFVNLGFNILSNSGNAQRASYNQQHRISIIGNVQCPSVNISYTRPLTFCEGDSTVLKANQGSSFSYQWYKNAVQIAGATAADLIVKESGSYFVSITSNGCTLPSSALQVTTNFGVTPPTTVSRLLTSGTQLTAGNGLQASSYCAVQYSGSYNGPTIGIDGGYQTAPDPTISINGAGNKIRKVKVIVKWKKNDGGDYTTCASPGTGNPYNSEVSFKIISPNNTAVELLASGTFNDGGTSPGSITTTFEDGKTLLGTVPATGEFSPFQPLSRLNGENPNGTWTLEARDAAYLDPLCLESFTIIVYTDGNTTLSTIKWYDAAINGNLLATGNEFLPSVSAVGIYTYYAEASCADPSLVCTKSLRIPATLTIVSPCATVAGSVSGDALVCKDSNTGSLILSGHVGTILRWESSEDNFQTSTSINQTTATLNYNNLSKETKFRAVVKNGYCYEGFSAPATIGIKEVNLMVNAQDSLYEGETIQLVASGASTYAWTGPNSFAASTDKVLIMNAKIVNSGNYQVVGTQNGCTTTRTIGVVVMLNDSCSRIIEYDYVQAGDPFIYKFPLKNNMFIAEVPESTSILVSPICSTVSLKSFRMKLEGLPYLHEVVENVPYFALFNNLGKNIYGRTLSPGNYTLTVTGYEFENASGKINYGPVQTRFTIVSSTAFISAPTFSISSLCPGTNFNVNFTSSGVFAPTNRFDVQLSDNSGTFDNPIVIGSSFSSGVVTCQIPTNISLKLGGAYKIRVVSTNQTLHGTNSNNTLTSLGSTVNLTAPNDNYSSKGNLIQVTNSITAQNKLSSTANVVYKAGNSVLLTAGFQADAGAVFKAEIGGCN